MRHLSSLIIGFIALLLSSCQVSKKSYELVGLDDFALNKHQLSDSKDAFLIDDGSSLKLILPMIFPKKFQKDSDKLWYELQLKGNGVNTIIHVRLVMDQLYKKQVKYTAHIINANTKETETFEVNTLDKSIIVPLYGYLFYHDTYKKFNNSPSLALYHNFKRLPIGKVITMRTQDQY